MEPESSIARQALPQRIGPIAWAVNAVDQIALRFAGPKSMDSTG
jgi:hypothetical protein